MGSGIYINKYKYLFMYMALDKPVCVCGKDIHFRYCSLSYLVGNSDRLIIVYVIMISIE